MKITAIALAASLLLPATLAAKTLRYSDHEPLGGMRTRFIKDVFFAAIDRESKGRLRIEEHWGGDIASGYDALRVVGEGRAADIAVVVPEYVEKDLPLQQVFKSFPVGPTAGRQVAFFRRAYAEIPEFSAELSKANVVNLFLATGYPVAFFGTKPMDGLDALKGGKWRTASFWQTDFLQNTGATPVSIPWGPEILKALQNGSLDGVMVNVDGGVELDLQKAAPNILISKNLWLGHVYLLVMNKDTWNGLAKDDQEAIERAAESAYTSLGAVMEASFTAQVDSLKRGGAAVRTLETKELGEWSVATRYQEVQSQWIKRQEEEGRGDAGFVLARVSSILAETIR